MKTQTNKWRIGFWIYFAISLILILYLFTKSSNIEVELAFSKILKIHTEKDLKIISAIVNNTDLSKKQILEEIAKDSFYKIDNPELQKIELERTILIFQMDKLVRIETKDDELAYK